MQQRRSGSGASYLLPSWVRGRHRVRSAALGRCGRCAASCNESACAAFEAQVLALPAQEVNYKAVNIASSNEVVHSAARTVASTRLCRAWPFPSCGCKGGCAARGGGCCVQRALRMPCLRQRSLLCGCALSRSASCLAATSFATCAARTRRVVVGACKAAEPGTWLAPLSGTSSFSMACAAG